MRAAAPFDSHSEFQAFLSDGLIVSGTTATDWLLMPEGIVAVMAWFDVSYITALSQDVRQVRQYRNIVHSRELYWLDDAQKSLFVENDKTGSVMPKLVNASLKVGALIADDEWLALMNKLFNLHHPLLDVTDWRAWLKA